MSDKMQDFIAAVDELEYAVVLADDHESDREKVARAAVIKLHTEALRENERLTIVIKATEILLNDVIADLRRQLAEALKDVERLREFAEFSLGQWSWGWDIPCGGSMQDRAEGLGIIVEVPSDEVFREEYESDTMFACAWSAAAKDG